MIRDGKRDLSRIEILVNSSKKHGDTLNFVDRNLYLTMEPGAASYTNLLKKLPTVCVKQNQIDRDIDNRVTRAPMLRKFQGRCSHQVVNNTTTNRRLRIIGKKGHLCTTTTVMNTNKCNPQWLPIEDTMDF